MNPRKLTDPLRKLHTIDAHERIFVVEESDKLTGDDNNSKILITDKASQNYECSVVKGIQSCHCIIAFKDDTETGLVDTNQTIYLRSDFCSCNVCRGATLPEHFDACR
jgi:hypothetical protein